MKRWFFPFVAMITFTVSANAMSYTQARSEALFLTDKMAYELGLNTMQQEMVYEINLDYLLTISGTSGYVLTTSQYRRYCNVAYFYRPIVWDGSRVYLRIYDRYTNRNRFYYPRPATYATFKGGKNRGTSWYNPVRTVNPTTKGSTWRDNTPRPANNARGYNNTSNNPRGGVANPPATRSSNGGSRGNVAPVNPSSGNKGKFGGSR